MSNPRVLIITGTTEIFRKPDETDNTMQEVFDLTLQSKIRYAKKHEYDILCLRTFGKDNNNIFKDTDVAHLRILRPIEMLQYYDYVFWLDADSIITNDNMKIENFELDPNIIFYGSWDWNGRYSISAGNYIFQKSDKLNTFFNYYIEISKYCGNEQETINVMYRQTPMRNHIKILDHKYLNAVPKEQESKQVWSGRQKIFNPWNKDCFIAHLTGIPNKDRIDILQNYFEEYI